MTSLQSRVDNVRRIIARVSSQPQETTWNESSGALSSGAHNAKLPELPSFRIPGAKLNFDNPSAFMVEFVDRLSANAIPESRYVGALITCLDRVDRGWVRRNMLEWNAASVASFVANFDEVDQKSSDIRKLQSCHQDAEETSQKYSDRFDALRKKLNKSDTDEELIEMFIGGLLPETKKSVDNAMATARCLFGGYEKTLPKLFALAKSLEPRKELEPPKEKKKPDEKRCHRCNAPGWTRNHRCKPKQVKKGQGRSQAPPDKANTTQGEKGKKTGSQDRKCYKCGEMGWTKEHVCDSSKKVSSSSVRFAPASNSKVAFEEEQFGCQAMDNALDELFSSSSSSKEPHGDAGDVSEFIYTPVIVNGVKTKALVDSGGNVSFINSVFAKKNGWKVKPDTSGFISHQKLKRPRVGTARLMHLSKMGRKL